MIASSRRAVLTGIGIISPIGLEPDAFWNSLRQGQSGIREIQSFDASGMPVRIAGVDVGDPKGVRARLQLVHEVVVRRTPPTRDETHAQRHERELEHRVAAKKNRGSPGHKSTLRTNRKVRPAQQTSKHRLFTAPVYP